MNELIEVIDNDPKGTKGGPLYRITPPSVEISLSDILNKPDAELAMLFYPKDAINYIRRQIL